MDFSRRNFIKAAAILGAGMSIPLRAEPVILFNGIVCEPQPANFCFDMPLTQPEFPVVEDLIEMRRFEDAVRNSPMRKTHE